MMKNSKREEAQQEPKRSQNRETETTTGASCVLLLSYLCMYYDSMTL